MAEDKNSYPQNAEDMQVLAAYTREQFAVVSGKPLGKLNTDVDFWTRITKQAFLGEKYHELTAEQMAHLATAVTRKWAETLDNRNPDKILYSFFDDLGFLRYQPTAVATLIRERLAARTLTVKDLWRLDFNDDVKLAQKRHDVVARLLKLKPRLRSPLPPQGF